MPLLHSHTRQMHVTKFAKQLTSFRHEQIMH